MTSWVTAKLPFDRLVMAGKSNVSLLPGLILIGARIVLKDMTFLPSVSALKGDNRRGMDRVVEVSAKRQSGVVAGPRVTARASTSFVDRAFMAEKPCRSLESTTRSL